LGEQDEPYKATGNKPAIYFYEWALRYTVTMATGYAEVDNGLLYYETAGKGPALVLIHAGFLDSRMWDDQFELFSKTHKVIRYDVRGFGKSDIATSAFSNYSDLHALLEYLRVERASLLGVSMGGSIALDFAVEHPNEVQSLILVSPGVSGYKPSDSEEERLRKEFEVRMEPQEKAIREGRAEDVVRMDLEAWAPLQNQASHHRLREIALENFHVHQEMPWKLQVDPDPPAFEILSSIHVPTLFILGDREVPAQTVEVNNIHSRMPGSQRVVIPRADHIANVSRPDEFNGIVLEFLGRHTLEIRA
jgi:pimeloyl-ACP methyl ester carboxylesterase